MTNDIMIYAPQCGGRVVFDNMQVALAFMRMLAETITPEAFVDFVRATVPSPDAVDTAKTLSTACMGTPS